METQSAKIILKQKALLRPMTLREAVQKTDFTSGDIHITASGQVAANQDTTTQKFAGLVFKLPDTGQIFLLVSAPEQKATEQKTKDTLPQLRKTLKTGRSKFILSGRVHKHKDLPIGLTVEDFTEIKDD